MLFRSFMMRSIGFTHQGPTFTLRKEHWKTEILHKIQSNSGDYWMRRPQEKRGDFAAPLQFLEDKKNLGGEDCNFPKLAYS